MNESAPARGGTRPGLVTPQHPKARKGDMANITPPMTERATVVVAGRIPCRADGRPARMVVLDTTGPAPVRVELIRTPAPVRQGRA